MIVDPVTISPDITIRQALEIMNKYRISGLPVTRGTRLTGILTNRDLRFEKNHTQMVGQVMTKDNLVTVPVGTTLEEAEKILQKHRIENGPACFYGGIIDSYNPLESPLGTPPIKNSYWWAQGDDAEGLFTPERLAKAKSEYPKPREFKIDWGGKASHGQDR